MTARTVPSTSLRGLLLPILSGLLLALCFPPFHLLLVPFVALVPFALHLRAPSGSRPRGAWGSSAPSAFGGRGSGGGGGGQLGGRRAFLAGAVLGLVYFGLLLHWLVPALLWLSPVGPLLFGVVVLILGGLVGGVGWATHRLVHRTALPAALALPLAWTAGEWIRGHLPGGLAFPWLGLGSSLTAYPELVGFAELVGARGVTFWVVLVNGLVAELVWRVRSAAAGRPGGGDGRGGIGRRWSTPRSRILLALTLVVLIPMGWSVWRARTLSTTPVARVALAQTRVPAEVKADPERALEVTRAQLRSAGFGDGASSFGDPDLVIWPETTFPFPLASRSQAVEELVGSVVSEEGAPVLFGATEVGAEVGGGRGGDVSAGRNVPRYNSAFLLTAPSSTAVPDPSGPSGPVPRRSTAGGRVRGAAGSPPTGIQSTTPATGVQSTAPATGVQSITLPEGIRSVYRKRFLVPLVERAPRLLPSFLPLPDFLLDGVDGELSPGGVPDPVSLPGGTARFGILICFESAFPAASREYRRRGADFLVNLTNDVWFGDGSSFSSRAGAEQHAAHLVMRALESRMGVARSANGGRTFFVDPVGRIHGRAPAGDPAATVGPVARSGRETLYVRTGDWLGPGCVLFVTVILVAGALTGADRRAGWYRGIRDSLRG